MSQERSFSKTRFCSSTSSLVPRTHQNEDQPADWLTTKINQVILGKKFDKIDTALHELKSQAMDALDAISSENDVSKRKRKRSDSPIPENPASDAAWAFGEYWDTLSTLRRAESELDQILARCPQHPLKKEEIKRQRNK